ncbi:MAG: hypothetical protein R2712_11565 [Vicinamibacterales bacterium]
MQFVRLLSMLSLGIALGSQSISSRVAIAIPAAVADQVSADGSALVIVGVRAAFVPRAPLMVLPPSPPSGPRCTRPSIRR